MWFSQEQKVQCQSVKKWRRKKARNLKTMNGDWNKNGEFVITKIKKMGGKRELEEKRLQCSYYIEKERLGSMVKYK